MDPNNPSVRPGTPKAISAFSSCESAREDIDAQIQQLEKSIRSLRYRRNMLAPINTLPPELLTEIFMLVAGSQHWGLTEGSAAQFFNQVNGVCLLWREISIGYPRLWCDVRVGSSEWTEIQLSRSNPIPIDLVCNSAIYCSHFLSTFSRHAHRIRRSRLVVDWPKVSALKKLLRLLESAPQRLEVLELNAMPDGSFVPLTFSPSCQLPSLRQLELNNIYPVWSPPCLTNLTHLSIISTECTLPLDQLLGMLNSTPLLEFLKLSRNIAFAECDDTSSETCCGTANLGHLSHLELEAAGLLMCSHFTTHLKFPPKAYVGLKALEDNPGLSVLREATQMLVSHAPLHNHSTLIIDYSFSIKITLQSVNHPSPHIWHLKIWHVPNFEDGDFVGASFGAFQQLTTVELALNRAESLDWCSWWLTLCEMPQIVELRVRKCRRPSPIFGLFAALEVEQFGLLPRMRKLDIEGVRHNPSEYRTVSGTLPPTLVMRMSKGTRLHHLRLVRIGIPGGDMAAVERLVEVLDYCEGSDGDATSVSEDSEDE